MSKLKTTLIRTITAAVLILLVVFALYFDFFFYLAYAIGLVSIFEVCNVLYKKNKSPLIIAAGILSACFATVATFFPSEYLLFSLIAGIIIIISIGIFTKEADLSRYVHSIFAFIYPALFFCFLFLLLKTGDKKIAILALILNIALVSFADTFAYFTGMFFGRTKLCPEISPKKTVEGAIGGLIAAIAAGYVMSIIAVHYGINIAFWHYLILGAICGVLSVCGDLIASIVKRSAGVKDYAGILPGMGGFMDRIDGIIFCSAPIYFYFTMILNYN